MAQPPIYEIDADGTIRTDALHWEGFPRILWETLSEVGYVTPPLYEVVSFWDQGVPYAPHNRYGASSPRAPGVGGLEHGVLCSPRCGVG
jgi:hypothetical protein